VDTRASCVQVDDIEDHAMHTSRIQLLHLLSPWGPDGTPHGCGVNLLAWRA
jgi:hypothetical protein